MNTERIAVVTDSSCILPDALRRELDIHVVPLTVEIGGRTYQDGVDVSPSEFYRKMSTIGTPPRTSQPAPGTFLKVFLKLAPAVDRILCLTLSAKLSGTANSALQAARLFREEAPPGVVRPPVEVIDTRVAAAAAGLVVVEAARSARTGAPWAEVLRRSRWVAERTRLVVAVDTLEYLIRGGHVPRLIGMAAEALRLKPMIQIVDGEAVPAGVALSIHHSYQVMLRRMTDEGQAVHRSGQRPRLHVAVMHAGAVERGQQLLALVQQTLKPTESYLTDFTPAMGAHTGPGLVGVGYFIE